MLSVVAVLPTLDPYRRIELQKSDHARGAGIHSVCSYPEKGVTLSQLQV